MILRRLDAEKLHPVAHLNTKSLAVPIEVGGPIHASNAIDCFIRGRAVAGLIPGLEAQSG